MIVLTDNKEWSNRLLAELIQGPAEDFPRGNWRDLSPSQLHQSEQLLWASLGNNTPLHRCEIATVSGLSDWNYLIVIEEAAESQFDILRRLDPAKLPGSVACIAITGHGFHGHHARSWLTRRGNLHLSTICDPNLDAASCGLAMTTLPAVAVVDTLSALEAWSSEPGIKWVNDILIDQKKVAGVLTATQSLSGNLTGLTLGIGLNIESAPDVSDTPFVPRAGCLAEFNTSAACPTIGNILGECLRAISTRLIQVRNDGPKQLLQAYRDRNLIVGRRVIIWPDNAESSPAAGTNQAPLAEGVVLAIGPDLSITIEGLAEPITRGRLAFAPNPQPH